jgi:hypothetical protein
MGWRRLVVSLAALITLAVAAGVFAPVSRSDAPGYAIDGLRVTPPVGAFGGMPVNSCDFAGYPDYPGCRTKTFTLTNVGSEPILFNGFGIHGGTNNAALVPLGPEWCAYLPEVGGHWALQPGASCDIGATFNAIQKGMNENELWVFHLDQFSPIAVIPLFAEGT